MNLITLFKNSFKVLKVNKNRTILTMLGIVIGIAGVIIIMSVGAGAQSLIFNQITSVGSNLIGIMPGYSDDESPPASIMGIALTTLKNSDAQALKQIKEIESITSYARGVETVTWQNQKTDSTFIGTTSEYPLVESAEIELGNFFNQSVDKAVVREIVLGWQIWQDLFGNENPVGKRVKIKRENFRVIGVMKKRGVQGFQNQDTLVFIPLKSAQKLLLGINYVSMIRAKVTNDDDVPIVIEQIKQILREQHNVGNKKPDDFTVRAATQALDALAQITNALKLFLTCIAGISLLVGGVGIMNIMLVAVNERTHEIGLRKAIGATKSNIQTQFLIESIILTILGGIIGILIGVLFSGLIASVAKYLGYNWDFIVSVPSILLGVGVSGFVGIIFGWYPARRAAKLEPVEALRYE